MRWRSADLLFPPLFFFLFSFPQAPLSPPVVALPGRGGDVVELCTSPSLFFPFFFFFGIDPINYLVVPAYSAGAWAFFFSSFFFPFSAAGRRLFV